MASLLSGAWCRHAAGTAAVVPACTKTTWSKRCTALSPVISVYKYLWDKDSSSSAYVPCGACGARATYRSTMKEELIDINSTFIYYVAEEKMKTVSEIQILPPSTEDAMLSSSAIAIVSFRMMCASPVAPHMLYTCFRIIPPTSHSHCN